MTNTTINLEKTGDNIKRIRKNKHITVADLVSELGFQNPQSVYKWERGENLPSVDNLVILSKVLDTSIDDILVLDN